MHLRIPRPFRGRALHASSAEFENPLPVPCRIAIIAPNYQEKNGVRTFDESQVPDIQNYRPEILVGTVAGLLRLAPALRVSRAVVAFSGARLGPLTGRHRDLLWQAFQVPIFEHSLGPDGSVVARECEAHQGLHLYLPRHHHGPLDPEPCPCGRPEPLIGS